MRDRAGLHTMVINSLEEQIAVIDQAGMIVDVNVAWLQFGVENTLSTDFASLGANYLEVLRASAASGDSLAAEAAQGISEVLNGKRVSFYLEYPCHSPEKRRWFLMRVVGLKGGQDNLFVISHHNITERKVAEEKVEYLAMHDPLTSLANRRYFNETLSNEIRRGIRNESVVSLIVLDVDHFKDYNDQLGHLAGDQCLIRVGQVLHAFSHRAGDLASRLGGDEFALILGGTGYAEVREIAEAIRKTVYDLGLIFGGSKRITISLGAVSVVPHMDQGERFLFEEADKALYRAKLAGRNCVVHEKYINSQRG
jgi:diguanylate cyclase (GGDEF)-like protein